MKSTFWKGPNADVGPTSLSGGDFRLGSIATKLGRQRHVRFTLDSDRTADMAECRFRAKSGLMHRNDKLLLDHLVG